MCRCHGILDRTTFLEADFFWFPNRSGASTSDGAVPKTPGSVHIDTRYGVFGCYELKARNEKSREFKTFLAGFEVRIYIYTCIYIYIYVYRHRVVQYIYNKIHLLGVMSSHLQNMEILVEK